MARIRIAALAVCSSMLLCLNMNAQENPVGTIAYALPQTTISLEVEAVQEHFFAGPYARFAQKYLGIEASQDDRVSYHLSSVKLTPSIEADANARYIAVLPSGADTPFLQMTAQGLVSTSEGSFGKDAVWRFPAIGNGDFSDKGISNNLTTEASTLYHNSKSAEEYGRIAVSQSIVVAKTLEQKAQEAANMVLDLRKKRIQIITGDTDATFSGEAMAAAIAEIEKLEKEYLSLFIGYCEQQTQSVHFDVVPASGNENQVYVAFRISDTDGLVPSDNLSGKPYLLNIEKDEISQPVGNARGGSSKSSIYYRTPCICNIRLTDGVNLLLQTRIPIYQFGTTNSFPLSK